MTIKATIIKILLDDSGEQIKTVLKCYDNDSSNFERYDIKIKGDIKKYEASKTYELNVLPSIFNNKLYLRLDGEQN